MSQKEYQKNHLKKLFNLLSQDLDRLKQNQKLIKDNKVILSESSSAYSEIISSNTKASNLLSTIQRQRQISELIANVGLLLFLCTILFILSRRINFRKVLQLIYSVFETYQETHQLKEDV